jgi:hypothetical protein
MRLRILLLIGALPAAAAAQDLAPSDRDGTFVESASVPSDGTVRLSAGGGAVQSEEQLAPGTVASAGAKVLWSFHHRTAGVAAVTWAQGRMAPAASLRHQLLSQLAHGVDLTASARLRAIGGEQIGSELDARLALGRHFGRLSATVNTMVGKAFSGRQDVDFETGARLAWRHSVAFSTGLEARAHGELHDELKTVEDEGRPVGTAVGAAAALQLDGLHLQALVGWTAPRGPFAPGPIALATVSFDF